MKTIYDMTALDEFFSGFEKPDELMKDIVNLAFRYALAFDENDVESFKDDMSTLYMIHDLLSQTKPIEATIKG